MSKKYKKVRIVAVDLDSIECDCCHELYSVNTPEYQEMISIHNDCGYGSVFGDGNSYDIDLCQSCVDVLLGKYLKFSHERF